MFNLHVRKTEKQTKREKKVKSGVEWREEDDQRRRGGEHSARI